MFNQSHIWGLVFLALSLTAGCEVDDPLANPASDYPSQISAIIETQCAVTGCHDATSNAAAAGLNLESWETLFMGSRNNAVVVPFRTDQSFMMFFVNTFTEFGPSLTPNMPFGSEPLTKGSVVASDAFFPFSDGLLTAAEAGATAVIQPGGSMRDDEVIKAADEAGLAMVYTGMRHFRH